MKGGHRAGLGRRGRDSCLYLGWLRATSAGSAVGCKPRIKVCVWVLTMFFKKLFDHLVHCTSLCTGSVPIIYWTDRVYH